MGLEDFTADTTNGPNIVLANISQDHWRSCASGPSNPEKHGGHSGPWTAIPQDGQNPSYVFDEGDLVLARRTNRTSEGKVGNLDSGVCGIWKYNRSAAVDSQRNHPWDKEYRWYIYCDNIETSYSPIYDEDWDYIDLVPQKMAGMAIYKLSSKNEKLYLKELLNKSEISDKTRNVLEGVLDAKR